MKHLSIISLLLCASLFIRCGGEDDGGGSSNNSEEIGGSYLGILINSTTGEQGVVTYSFESIGNDTYTGFYEGGEFGEVTVNGTLLTGSPSDGNTAFTTLSGQINGNQLSFTLFSDQGIALFVFSGTLTTSIIGDTEEITIDDNTYVRINDPIDVCGTANAVLVFLREGDLEPKVFFTIIFGEDISAGDYQVSSELSGQVVSISLSYNGNSFDASGGSLTVAGSTDSVVTYDFSNVIWEQIDGNTPGITGTPSCIF